MGRHRHKKVSDKDAEENITKQLVESGKKEELKNMVHRKFSALSLVCCLCHFMLTTDVSTEPTQAINTFFMEPKLTFVSFPSFCEIFLF